MAKLTPSLNERDHVDGPDNALITLVEYGDFECPHCGAAYPIVKRIQKVMGSELRFAWRHFPLTEIHPHALHAAYAAEAAAMQDRFWGMHDRLLENQDALEDEDLIAYAQSLELDVQQWMQDFSSPDVQEIVQVDFSSGVRSGVNGTPTFFINGVRHDASFEYPVLLAALQRQVVSQRQQHRRSKPQPQMKGR